MQLLTTHPNPNPFVVLHAITVIGGLEPAPRGSVALGLAGKCLDSGLHAFHQPASGVQITS